MGKRIIARARGKGGPRYRAPSHRYLGKVSYASGLGASGRVVDIVHDPGRSAPVAIVKLKSGKKILHIAPHGLSVGDEIKYGDKAKVGNVLRLADIPVGTRISGIESYPNSGPKMCRSSGSVATVVATGEDEISVQFSSGKIKRINANCRATIGVPAGGGRREKPWVKAGKRHRAMMARGKLYPRTVGVAMTPTDHPYGGKKKAPRPSGTVSRHAPPGAKVGSIAARRMGKRKRK